MPKRSCMAQLAEGLALEKALTAGAVYQFVTVRQAASLLQVSERTIRRLIADDELPAYRLHGMVRIQWSDVMRLLKYGPAAGPKRRRRRRRRSSASASKSKEAAHWRLRT